MTDSLILLDRPMPGCAVLTLNRPKSMNTLSHALRRELVQTIRTLGKDPSVRVLVLTGAGPAFCAGFDLKELGAGADGNVLELENLDLNPIVALEQFPWPTIGAINGVAITGGFELALACDVLLASDKARFADTHARVGVIPFWGLVSRVVPHDRLMAEAIKMAEVVLTTVPDILLAYKRLINDGHPLSLSDGMALEAKMAIAASVNIDPVALKQCRHDVRVRGKSRFCS